MPVAALPGNVRFRAFQLGLQTVFGTPVTATRRMPWRYNPTVDPHWTSPDVDTGTLDPAIAPYRMAIDVTGQATGPLAYNDAGIMWAGLLKGGVSPTGPTDSIYEWLFAAASTSQDQFELTTGEWGDDTADDFRYVDGVIDSLQLSFPQDLGPVQIQADYRWSSVDYPDPLTGSLDVDSDPDWVSAADTSLYIDDAAGSIGITPLVNSMHDAQIQIQNNLDVKRFANGSNANFEAAGYARGARTGQTTITFAKSTQALDEVADWLNADPVQRFLAFDSNSRRTVGSASHRGQRIRFSGHWFTRSEQAVGSNSAVQLVCNHIYDPDLAYAIQVRVRNTMSALL